MSDKNDRKFCLLYKTYNDKLYYVSNYTIAKLDGKKILGGCIVSDNIGDAKIFPIKILNNVELLDISIRVLKMSYPLIS